MGKLIRLDTAITDLSAPILPHAAGVAGYRNRYIASHVSAASGTVLTQLTDSASTLNLLNFAGTPANTIEGEGNIRYVKSIAGAVAGGRFIANSGIAGNFSFLAVMRIPTIGGGGSLGVNGVEIQRAGNGSYQMRNIAPTATPQNPAGWQAVGVTWDGTADLYLGGTPYITDGVQSGAIGTQVVIGAYSANFEVDVAELIIWPRALTAAEHAAAGAAMKNRYVGLL